MFIYEITEYWKGVEGVRTIWSEYQKWNPGGYIALDDSTPMNDTTLTTNSDPKKHYGQNAYADVVAPAVYAKMVAAGVL